MIPTTELAPAIVASALTLYMLALILRWVGPWIELDLEAGWLRFVPRLTDPLISLMRRLLPPMGPMDWAPIAAIVVVWFLRIILVQY